MFSFSVILESIFPEVFPRQLSGGHTHLFTDESIKKMNSIIGVESLAEWRFGTDIMDLYRSIITMLNKNKASNKVINIMKSEFANTIDKLQTAIDERHFCSEIHCLSVKL